MARRPDGCSAAGASKPLLVRCMKDVQNIVHELKHMEVTLPAGAVAQDVGQ